MVDSSWVVVCSHVLVPGVGSLDRVMEDGHQLSFREKAGGSVCVSVYVYFEGVVGWGGGGGEGRG